MAAVRWALRLFQGGASSLCFIDQNPHVIRQIQQHIQQLDCEDATAIMDNAITWLENQSTVADENRPLFDIVFLDPPFDTPLLEQSLASLVASGLLKSDALVYVETAKHQGLPSLDSRWQIHRQKTTGNVNYALIIFSG